MYFSSVCAYGVVNTPTMYLVIQMQGDNKQVVLLVYVVTLLCFYW